MQNQNNQPINNNEEVDIIALFEYFRKGFWNLIGVIAGIFLFFFNLLIRLYLLLKKNLVLVGSIVILSGVAGFLYNKFIPKSFYYEMVVRANYNSVYELFNYVESLGEDLAYPERKEELAKKIGYSPNEIEKFSSISVEPVENFEDVLATYYGVKGSPFTPSVRDSIFYKTYEIVDFEERMMREEDYSLQKVSITTSEPIDPNGFEESLLKNVNEFSVFSSQKGARIKALNAKEEGLKRSLARIDSLLVGISNQSTTPSPNGLTIRGEAKSNLEEDLIKQSREITDELFSVEIQREMQERILTPYSKIRQINPRTIKPNLFTGVIAGIFLGLALLLLLEANRAINSYAKKNLK